MKTFKKYILLNRGNAASLAKNLGVSCGTVHHWFIGKSKPRVDMAIKIECFTNGFVTVYDWME